MAHSIWYHHLAMNDNLAFLKHKNMYFLLLSCMLHTKHQIHLLKLTDVT